MGHIHPSLKAVPAVMPFSAMSLKTLVSTEVMLQYLCLSFTFSDFYCWCSVFHSSIGIPLSPAALSFAVFIMVAITSSSLRCCHSFSAFSGDSCTLMFTMVSVSLSLFGSLLGSQSTFSSSLWYSFASSAILSVWVSRLIGFWRGFLRA